MKKTLNTLFSFFLLITTHQALADQNKPLMQLLDKNFHNLIESNQSLQNALTENKNCLQSEEVFAAYDKFSEAWQKNWVYTVFSTKQSNYKFLMQFFPDKRGRISREVYRVISSDLSPTEISKVRNYGKGLPSLEILFFDQKIQSKSSEERICSFALAITNYLKKEVITKASQQHKDWMSDSKTSSKAKDIDHSFYNSMISALENLKKTKILRAITGDKIHNRRFESWRSNSSLQNMMNNLVSIKEIFEASYHQRVVDQDYRHLSDNFFKEWKNLSNEIKNFGEPLSQTTSIQKVNALALSTSRLIRTLKVMASPQVLNIPGAFNGADGD